MVGSLYLCINAVETKSLMFQFPLSIMNTERDAYIETFPEKDVDSEMLRRLQMRIIEAVLRIVNADDCEMVTLYPRNYYIIGSRGVETENGTSPDYIPICDAKLYTTNHFSFLKCANGHVRRLSHINSKLCWNYFCSSIRYFRWHASQPKMPISLI